MSGVAEILERPFAVGDEVWWHVPTVMDHCRTWTTDISKPVTIIAVQDRPCPRGIGHPQLVRVSPNYCPYGDEFEGSWFLPVGIKHHTDPSYRAARQAAEAVRQHDGGK